MFKKLFKNNNGFTLTETLISIAALALMSGFILQMFMVSSNANTKAQNIDKASSEALCMIETLKSLKSYDDLFDNDLLGPGFSPGNENAFYYWYNAEWELIDSTNYTQTRYNFDNEGEQYPNDARFAIKLSMTEKTIPNAEQTLLTAYSLSNDAPIKKYQSAGNFIEITAQGFDLEQTLEKRELALYNASKYFFAD